MDGYSDRVAVLVLLVVVLMGVALWRATARRGEAPVAHPRRRIRSRARFVPPDDDPEFLRGLDRRARGQDDEPG